MTLAVLALAAFATATLSGVLGMGGGMTLLGAMTALLPASAVVPVHGVVQLVSNSTRTLAFLEHVSWRIFAIYAGPLTAGVAAASLVWSGDKLSWFKPGIGLFLLVYVATRHYKPVLRNIPLWAYAPLGAAIGFLTVFVGATGPLIAPFFLRDDLSKEQVIATKAVCQTWGHFLKIPAFLALGFDYRPWMPTLALLAACVVAGTLLGKWLLSRVSRPTFERLFLGLLSAIAVWLLLGPIAH